jgi:hypothetical protein
VVDAESFFVRNTNVQEVIASYLKNPHLIVSSRKRYEDQQDMATRRAVGIAEVRLSLSEIYANLFLSQSYPHTLEEYFWLWDASLLGKVALQIANYIAQPNSTNPDGTGIWIDVAYYNSIQRSRRLEGSESPWANWRILDTTDFWAEDFEVAMSHCKWNGIFEGARFVINDVPDQAQQFARHWVDHNIRTVRCQFHDETGTTFLKAASTIVLCTSDSDQGILSNALDGAFN